MNSSNNQNLNNLTGVPKFVKSTYQIVDVN